MSEPAPEAISRTPQYAEAVQPPRSALLSAAAWFRDLMLAVLIAVLAILFLYRPVRVEGTSMIPSLYNQERLFINQFSYRFGLSNIKRGDTVVFWFPEDTTKSYIKRVIGLPGNRVQIINGYVYINGKKMAENYVPQRYRGDGDWGPKIVPPHQYFVLGDDRVASNDSRAWGFVPRSYIYGKAVFVFWPLDRIGEVH
jgi:signal peptidase I